MKDDIKDLMLDASNVEDLAKLLMVCDELGLKYNGEWPDTDLFVFTITNKDMVCCGTTFATKDTSKNSLVFEMNRKEMQWINAGDKVRRIR
jgi:hypothetical protein